jgi:hypothetical protein
LAFSIFLGIDITIHARPWREVMDVHNQVIQWLCTSITTYLPFRLYCVATDACTAAKSVQQRVHHCATPKCCSEARALAAPSITSLYPNIWAPPQNSAFFHKKLLLAVPNGPDLLPKFGKVVPNPMARSVSVIGLLLGKLSIFTFTL